MLKLVSPPRNNSHLKVHKLYISFAGKTYIGIKMVHAILSNSRPSQGFANLFMHDTHTPEAELILKQQGPQIGPLLVVGFGGV